MHFQVTSTSWIDRQRGIIVMNETKNTDAKLSLFPDDLTSLVSLGNVLPVNQRKVLCGLVQHVEPGTWKSVATRKQLKESTGLSLSTIYRIITEFRHLGLFKQWKGPRGVNQCFYRINLPVPETAVEYYRKGAPAGKIPENAKGTAESRCHQQEKPATATNVVSIRSAGHPAGVTIIPV